MKSKPLQMSLGNMLYATLAIAVWLAVLRVSFVAGTFIVLTVPLLIALWNRKILLQTRIISSLPVRVPLFVILFFMFYVAILGPISWLLPAGPMPAKQTPIFVATVVLFSPVYLVCEVFPNLRDPCGAYLNAWRADAG